MDERSGSEKVGSMSLHRLEVIHANRTSAIRNVPNTCSSSHLNDRWQALSCRMVGAIAQERTPLPSTSLEVKVALHDIQLTRIARLPISAFQRRRQNPCSRAKDPENFNSWLPGDVRDSISFTRSRQVGRPRRFSWLFRRGCTILVPGTIPAISSWREQWGMVMMQLVCFLR